MAIPGLILLCLAVTAARPSYQPQAPIVIQNQPTSPDKPLIIEGYEISNPDGPGIQVRDVDYVVIRNNFLHDCGTLVSEEKQRLVEETGDARKGMLDKPFETGAILVFDAKGTVEISGTRILEHGGRTRTYIVHIPPKYDPQQPTPVVLAFHGGGSNAEQMVRFCGLNEKANKESFIVVYPNGTGRLPGMLTWNGGNCCAYAMWNNVDDVGFTRTLLDDLVKVVNVDAQRVFATGISNGGIMCYRLASELSDRIAAIAPVAGTMGTATCNPKRPVSVIHFHGTDDEYLPFKGGTGTRSLTQTAFYSVEHSITAWVKANGCPETPVATDEPKKTDDGTTVQRKTYGPGKAGAEVVLFVINGGGHTWPGRDPRVRFLGKSTQNISANDLMWEFFQRHSMK